MPSSANPPHVVIIGGGFAGAAVALRLLKDAKQPLRLTVIEGRAQIGLGVAYSTAHPEHLVNGPARVFSAYDDDPEHLVRWLGRHGEPRGWRPSPGTAIADSLPPRQLYGAYVRETLFDAIEEAGGTVSFNHRRGRAVDVARQADAPSGTTRYRVSLASGDHEDADVVVLATGIHPRRLAWPGIDVDPAVGSSPRYVHDIWAAEAWKGVADDAQIVYLGGGLSALDSLIIAEKAGFRGTHTVITRRGLPVHAREDQSPWPDFLQYDPVRPVLRDVLAQIRRERRELARSGESWQRLVTAIRPHVPALWAAASDQDRRRFLTRLRSYWEASLHRTASEPLQWQTTVADEGRFRHQAGRVVSLALRDDGRLAVGWRPRATAAGVGDVQILIADRVVNCLGFEFDWQKIDDPLVRQLIARGLVTPDPLGFGIGASSSDHSVLDADGQPQAGLYAVGHPLRGVIWESNAISEHVPQAGAVGRAIVSRLGQRQAADELEAA